MVPPAALSKTRLTYFCWKCLNFARKVKANHHICVIIIIIFLTYFCCHDSELQVAHIPIMTSVMFSSSTLEMFLQSGFREKLISDVIVLKIQVRSFLSFFPNKSCHNSLINCTIYPSNCIAIPVLINIQYRFGGMFCPISVLFV